MIETGARRKINKERQEKVEQFAFVAGRKDEPEREYKRRK